MVSDWKGGTKLFPSYFCVLVQNNATVARKPFAKLDLADVTQNYQLL